MCMNQTPGWRGCGVDQDHAACHEATRCKQALSGEPCSVERWRVHAHDKNDGRADPLSLLLTIVWSSIEILHIPDLGLEAPLISIYICVYVRVYVRERVFDSGGR